MQLRRPSIFQRDQAPRAGSRRNARGSAKRTRDASTRFELGRAAAAPPKRHIPWGRWFRGVAAVTMLGALVYGATWLYLSDTIRVRTENGASALGDVEGVQKIEDFGQVQELQVAGSRDPQAIVADILSRTRLRSFEMARPSLHDIFVRIAGPESRENGDA